MKILILQSAGKHEANKKYRECLCMWRALNRIDGVEAMIWGPGHDTYQKPFAEMAIWADAVLVLENYWAKPWLPDMKHIKALKLFWSIDAHIAMKRHAGIVNRLGIDIVLNSTGRYVKNFKSGGRKSLWFPNCYPADLIGPRKKVAKRFDVGFCGSMVRGRDKWIKELSRQIGLQCDIFVLGDAMVTAINSYHIHWNRNYSCDVNYRTFETLGCRTCLVTNNTDRLKDMFHLGKHLIVYHDIADCIAKIRELQHDPAKTNRIAEAGYEHVKAHHTYDNRAQQLVDIIKENG